jgi:hypothetical protein
MTSSSSKMKYIPFQKLHDTTLASSQPATLSQTSKISYATSPVHRLIIHPTAGQSGVTFRQGRAGHQTLLAPPAIPSHPDNMQTSINTQVPPLSEIKTLFRAQVAAHSSTSIISHPSRSLTMAIELGSQPRQAALPI